MARKNTKEMEEMKKAIDSEKKGRKKATSEIKLERNKNIFRNLILASAIMIYSILLNVGYFLIEKTIFTRDSVIFSFAALIAAVLLFERAYRTEKEAYVLHGLEILVMAIFTYFIPYTYFSFEKQITMYIMLSPVIFILYYFIKIIAICIKARNKNNNEIIDIVKKEEVKDDDSWIKVDKEIETEDEVEAEVVNKPIKEIKEDDDNIIAKPEIKPKRKTQSTTTKTTKAAKETKEPKITRTTKTAKEPKTTKTTKTSKTTKKTTDTKATKTTKTTSSRSSSKSSTTAKKEPAKRAKTSTKTTSKTTKSKSSNEE